MRGSSDDTGFWLSTNTLLGLGDMGIGLQESEVTSAQTVSGAVPDAALWSAWAQFFNAAAQSGQVQFFDVTA